jgi:hypothetical protein
MVCNLVLEMKGELGINVRIRSEEEYVKKTEPDGNAGSDVLVCSRALANPSLCDAVTYNSVQNCGFETGDYTGWTLSGDLRYTFVSNNPVNSGTYAAWFAGGDLTEFGLPGFTAFMDQTITAVPGSSFFLSFVLTNNQGCSGYAPEPASTASCQFSLSRNGTTLFNIIDPAAFGFTTYNFYNLIAGSTNTLEFASRHLPDWFVVDDVVAAPTPEPSSILLLSSLMLGVGVWRYKRRA